MRPALGARLGLGRRRAARMQIGMHALALRSMGAPSRTLALDGPGLEPVCAAVGALLAQHGPTKVEVHLACGWSRILLLPWIDRLKREEHWRNYAAARFEELYGDDAAKWELQLARDLPGRGRIAVAWPQRLRDALAAHRQVSSVRVGLLARLEKLLSHHPQFTGCVIELDDDGAGFLLLVAGVLQRVRWCRYDGAEALASAVHAEWASVLASQAEPANTPAALAVAPPALEAGSQRAAAVRELGIRLGIHEGFYLPDEL